MSNRKQTYLVGTPSTLAANAEPVSLDALAVEINELGNLLEAADTDTGEPAIAAAVVEKMESPTGEVACLVVEMTTEAATRLQNNHPGSVIIEKNEPIEPMDMDFHSLDLIDNFVPAGIALNLKFRVTGAGGEPIKNAKVTVFGEFSRESAMTGNAGSAKIKLMGESRLVRFMVKPAHSYWSFIELNPAQPVADEISVTLEKISTGFDSGDPAAGEEFQGWGQRDMGLSAPSANLPKVRLAVVDSGINSAHPDLSPDAGFDFGETDRPEETWSADGSSHGTHVAGICAADHSGFGIQGFAPDAELFALRIFPNASTQKLIGALDWCLENDIDVVNMSLGSKSRSLLIQQRIEACARRGILTVAAAGNSGNSVMFPAAYPEVIAVAAIGKVGTFPTTSSHQAQLDADSERSGAYFSPRFTCHGAEIDVCAPGVAITSCVQADGYAAWDGTSMASPHVAGVACRLLAERSTDLGADRNEARYTALREALFAACTPLPGLSAERQGRGFPQLSTPAVVVPDPLPQDIHQVLSELRRSLASAIELVGRME